MAVFAILMTTEDINDTIMLLTILLTRCCPTVLRG